MRYRSRGSRECYRLFTMICRSGLISIFLWLALLLLGYPKTACASHFVLLETGYRYEDNFSRTVSAGDQKDDWVFTTRLKIGKPVQLRAGLTSSVAVNFSKDFFNTYNRLENHSVGISISVNRKLGLGFYVPRLRFYTAWSDYRFKDDLWDNALFVAGLQIRKHFTDRFETQLAFKYDQRDANNAVFERSGRTVSVRTGYLVGQDFQLSIQFARREGDVVVHHKNWWPPGAPWTWDTTFNTKMAAYRVRARTKMLSLSLSKHLDRQSSLTAVVERQTTEWQMMEYPNDMFRVEYVRRY